MKRAGPLAGIRVVELAGIGPAPYCAMMLADMGAEVLLVRRGGVRPIVAGGDLAADVLGRGRCAITLDLKAAAGAERLLGIVEAADVLLEPYRPGVMERLGLGPDECFERNPRLIYARMTGWGQSGPLAARAGHDINFFALSGSLWLCGRAGEPPVANLNLVADMGGGGMMMAFAIACALIETARSGQGQAIDAAMVEGAASLAAMIHGWRAMGLWNDRRGTNLLDGGAPFYQVYATADGGFVAVGAIEPQFYALLLAGLGLEPAGLPDQNDRDQWPAMRERFAAIFSIKTRDEWAERFAATDACVTPVLSPDEAAAHPHAVHRAMFTAPDGVQQPAPAPRFSRTPGAIAGPPPIDDRDGAALLADWGLG